MFTCHSPLRQCDMLQASGTHLVWEPENWDYFIPKIFYLKKKKLKASLLTLFYIQSLSVTSINLDSGLRGHFVTLGSPKPPPHPWQAALAGKRPPRVMGTGPGNRSGEPLEGRAHSHSPGPPPAPNGLEFPGHKSPLCYWVRPQHL